MPITGVQKWEGRPRGVVSSRRPSGTGREPLEQRRGTKAPQEAPWPALGIPWPPGEVWIKFPLVVQELLVILARKDDLYCEECGLLSPRGRACQGPRQRDCMQAQAKSNESSDVNG